MSGRCTDNLHCGLLSDPRRDRLDGWIARNFVKGAAARADLSMDRSSFIQHHDIMTLIPEKIGQHIIHFGDNAQIQGFKELFAYLEQETPASETLRGLIIDYFARSPRLRGHLSELSLTASLV